MSRHGATSAGLTRQERARAEASPWQGPLRHYDIIKEAAIAVVVVSMLTVLLALFFSSPDSRPVTLQQWAIAQPTGFTDTALSELAGTSYSATYGPPYNHASGATQSLGPISPEKFFGVRYPVEAAESFVLRPLGALPRTAALSEALSRYRSAQTSQQKSWLRAYDKALSGRSLSASLPRVPAAGAGPVPELLSSLLRMARSGALDAQLVAHASFYTTNYTKPLLFLGDSWKAQHTASYWGQIVVAAHLRSSQWGVMNETGAWPGQPWLWLYTMWYQVPPMSSSPQIADIEVMALMAVVSVGLLLVPFLPVLRDIPRWLPLHRAIWRRYYRNR
ncbi:MAG: hypothetical protein ACYDGN_02545 [Acidimicrobiales bacterium]